MTQPLSICNPGWFPGWTVKVRCWVFSLLLLALLSPLQAASPDTYQNPLDVIIADPYVLQSQKTYYLYGTTVSHYGLQVFSSPDLINWRGHGYILHRTKTSWAKDHYWAPECFEHHGKFYLNYTAASDKTTMRICLAVADTPLGPFTDLKTPWLDPGQAVIDSDVFRDTDGQLYLYYVLDCSENKYSEIRVCKIADDLSLSHESSFCIKPSQSWEGETWNEGPCVFKHKDTYYMTYSGSGYFDPSYGLGYATAPSPLGPWTKSPTNPILQKTATVGGPGHNCVIPSPDGKEVFTLYHTLQNPGFNSARQLATDRIKFVAATDKSAPDILKIEGPTSTPQPFPSGSPPLVRGQNEEFNGPEIDRHRWTIFDENPQHWNLTGGRLVIQTADGDVAERRDDMENLFLQYAPLRDFTATTHLSIHPTVNYQNAFLCIWQDHDNFLKVATVYSDKPRLEVAIETDAHYDSHLFDNPWGGEMYLRIVRHWDSYSFLASADGVHWMPLMSNVKSHLTDLRVGVGAASPGTDRSTSATFDYLRFTAP